MNAPKATSVRPKKKSPARRNAGEKRGATNRRKGQAAKMVRVPMMHGENAKSAPPLTRHEDVLMTAAALCAERGLAGVSMRDIAAVIGFNMSALYYHFPSKADMYREICLWAFKTVGTEAARHLPMEGAPRERLKSYIDGLVIGTSPASSVAVRIVLQELLLGASGIDDYPVILKSHGVAAGTTLSSFIEELQPPLMKQIPALRLAEMIWDTIYAVDRNRAGHLRVFGGRRPAHDPARTSAEELLAYVCKLLDIEE